MAEVRVVLPAAVQQPPAPFVRASAQDTGSVWSSDGSHKPDHSTPSQLRPSAKAQPHSAAATTARTVIDVANAPNVGVLLRPLKRRHGHVPTGDAAAAARHL